MKKGIIILFSMFIVLSVDVDSFSQEQRKVKLPGQTLVVVRTTQAIDAEQYKVGSTVILDIAVDVKIDDQVHIGHNCTIGENTIIAACSEISGSVNIGKNCWIAPNSSIIQKVKIGDNVTIGIGSIVTKNIESNKKIMGLESLELKPLIKVKKRIEYGK